MPEGTAPATPPAGTASFDPGLAPAVPDSARSPNWPQFRGPAGTGVSLATNLPVTWGDGRNVAWRTRIKGLGASSPIVWDDHAYISVYRGYGVPDQRTTRGPAPDPQKLERHIVCYHRKTGREIWDHKVEFTTVDAEYKDFLLQHGYASSTLATDGKKIFGFFGVNGACAVSMNGRKDWNFLVGTRTHERGSFSSPILYQDLLIINASIESGAIGAVSKESGNKLWSYDGVEESWATPLLVDTPDGDIDLVISMRGQIVGLDPATGVFRWRCNGINDFISPSVVAGSGVVYATGGRAGEMIAVRAGGKGDVTNSHVLWKIDAGSNVPSPALHEGHLYWVSHQGRGYCVNAVTGEIVTQRRTDAGTVYASPVVADGKLYVVSRNNGTFVITATPEMEQLAHNVFASDETTFNASPAVARGQIYLRSNEFLYCIGEESAAPPASETRAESGDSTLR